MVPGVGSDLAAEIQAWVAERSGTTATSDVAPESDSGAMDEDDFMAALTRAFAEENSEEEGETADEIDDKNTANGAA